MIEIIALIVTVICLLSIAPDVREIRRLSESLRLIRAQHAPVPGGVLDVDAIESCMAPEMRWIASNDAAAAFVLFEAYGGDVKIAGQRLAQVARGHEQVYEVDTGTFVVLLWDSRLDGAVAAVARLGTHLLAAGVKVADAAVVLVADEATTPQQAWEIAITRRRPLQDFIDVAAAGTRVIVMDDAPARDVAAAA